MKVVILDTCLKEINRFPNNAKQAVFELISDLQAGIQLSMPLSKRMEGMGKGVYELRVRDISGIYRVIYVFIKNDAIYIIHGFQKKTPKTPIKNKDLAIKRIKRLK